MLNLTMARSHMIFGQILPHGVNNARLVHALNEVPRELFVPQDLLAQAYMDTPVDLEPGRTVLCPLTIAKMLDSVPLLQAHNVLNVGAGTGYVAALLSYLVRSVVALEDGGERYLRLKSTLEKADMHTVRTAQGPLKGGDPLHAPYDLIFINGVGPAWNCAHLWSQLKNGGHILGFECCSEDYAPWAVRITKQDETPLKERLFPAQAPQFTALIEKDPRHDFNF